MMVISTLDIITYIEDSRSELGCTLPPHTIVWSTYVYIIYAVCTQMADPFNSGGKHH